MLILLTMASDLGDLVDLITWHPVKAELLFHRIVHTACVASAMNITTLSANSTLNSSRQTWTESSLDPSVRSQRPHEIRDFKNAIILDNRADSTAVESFQNNCSQLNDSCVYHQLDNGLRDSIRNKRHLDATFDGAPSREKKSLPQEADVEFGLQVCDIGNALSDHESFYSSEYDEHVAKKTKTSIGDHTPIITKSDDSVIVYDNENFINLIETLVDTEDLNCTLRSLASDMPIENETPDILTLAQVPQVIFSTFLLFRGCKYCCASLWEL